MKKNIIRTNNEVSFFRFIISKENKIWFILSFLVSVIYFYTSNKLFPFPNLYSDSFTYIECANKHYPINFRPVEYSRFIEFFKQFSDTHIALVLAQFVLYSISNIFLLFTFTYFIKLSKLSKIALFIFLFINPIYIITSNGILSDPFFSSIAVIWFSISIWLLCKPNWLLFILQILTTILLFKLRYHGVIFPVLFITTCFFIPYNNWLKALFVLINIFTIYLIVKETTDLNEEYTNTKTFSAFSGWQMANNAIFVLQNKEAAIDTSAFEDIDDTRFKDFSVYLKKYLDTVKHPIIPLTVDATYIWNTASPLKKYLEVYLQKHETEFVKNEKNQVSYFEIWQAMGPIYNKVGEEVIMHHPILYFKNFIAPNLSAYFKPDLEAYQEYCANTDTIQKSVTNYYHFTNTKINKQSKEIYNKIIAPFPSLFIISNILFFISIITYIFLFWRKWDDVFIKILAHFSLSYLFNLGFISILAPTFFRYHIFIFTLLFPITLVMIEKIIFKLLNNKKAPQ